MNRREILAGVLLGVALAGCSGAQRNLPPGQVQHAAQAVSSSAPGQTEQAAQQNAQQEQLARGKELFVAKCGSCHDADGSKPLRSGPPLNQRPLTDEAIASEVGKRFRNATEVDKQAAIAYVRSFLKPQK